MLRVGPPSPAGEEGIALIAALFAVLILAGMAVVFVATATFESRSTAGSRDFESAVHFAESAVHALVPQLNEDPDGHVTEDANGQPHVFDPLGPGATAEEHRDATDAEQRAWFLDIAEDEARTPSTSPPLVRTSGGVGFAIRPRDVNGDPMDLIFAVGWVPDRGHDGPMRQRVLKLRFDALRYSPDFGFFSGGALDVGGSAAVRGDFGNVHANATADCQGSDFFIEGDFTSAGSMQCVSDSSTVGGARLGNVAVQPVPHISARALYDLAEPTAGDGWYDLCPTSITSPDPTIRAWSELGPCEGTILWTQGKSTKNFRGWQYQSSASQWRTQGNIHDGVYYVRYRNAQLGSMTSTSNATVIVEENRSGGIIQDNGSESGHIRVTGEAKLATALSGLTLIADRDIVMSGAAEVRGLIAANEQVRVGGEVTVTGAVIAQDEKDTPDSDISISGITGDMTINYDDQLDVPLTGVIRITAWNEL